MIEITRIYTSTYDVSTMYACTMQDKKENQFIVSPDKLQNG